LSDALGSLVYDDDGLCLFFGEMLDYFYELIVDEGVFNCTDTELIKSALIDIFFFYIEFIKC
jgi:hypothetical protein